MDFKAIPVLQALIATTLISASSFLAMDDFPEVTVEGLHRVHDSQLSVVYVEPGFDGAS